MMTLCTSSRSSRRARAFSLVEVVLALGIVSFALLSLLGLLPVGLRTFDQAMSTTTQGEIAQKVVNQLQQSSFTNSPTGVRFLYFTHEGLATNEPASVYRAAVSVPAAFSFSGAPSASPNILRVRVEITSRTAPQMTNTFTMHIANNRQ